MLWLGLLRRFQKVLFLFSDNKEAEDRHEEYDAMVKVCVCVCVCPPLPGISAFHLQTIMFLVCVFLFSLPPCLPPAALQRDHLVANERQRAEATLTHLLKMMFQGFCHAM